MLGRGRAARTGQGAICCCWSLRLASSTGFSNCVRRLMWLQADGPIRREPTPTPTPQPRGNSTGEDGGPGPGGLTPRSSCRKRGRRSSPSRTEALEETQQGGARLADAPTRRRSLACVGASAGRGPLSAPWWPRAARQQHGAPHRGRCSAAVPRVCGSQLVVTAMPPFLSRLA